MKHKIVCWGDYAIPMPLKAKWMAMDEDGVWWYKSRPTLGVEGEWTSSGESNLEAYAVIGSNCTNIIAPEPGPWRSQPYWIGD